MISSFVTRGSGEMDEHLALRGIKSGGVRTGQD